MAITRKQIRQKTAKSLGLLVSGVADDVTNAPVYVVNKLKDVAVDDYKMRYAYLHDVDDSGEWRLITSTDVSAGNVTVQRDFSTSLTNNDVVDLLLVLSPDEWNDLIDDEVLPEIYYIDRATLSLTAGQTEYNVTSAASWITDREQIIRARLRDVASGSTKPKEAEVPVAYFYEESNAVVMIVPGGYDVTDNRTVEIEARRYYTAPATDTTSININNSLVMAKTKHVALQKIFHKLGTAAKRTYGQQMVLAERDLAEEEARRQSHTVYRDWSDELEPEVTAGEFEIYWSW